MNISVFRTGSIRRYVNLFRMYNAIKCVEGVDYDKLSLSEKHERLMDGKYHDEFVALIKQHENDDVKFDVRMLQYRERHIAGLTNMAGFRTGFRRYGEVVTGQIMFGDTDNSDAKISSDASKELFWMMSNRPKKYMRERRIAAEYVLCDTTLPTMECLPKSVDYYRTCNKRNNSGNTPHAVDVFDSSFLDGCVEEPTKMDIKEYTMKNSLDEYFDDYDCDVSDDIIDIRNSILRCKCIWAVISIIIVCVFYYNLFF